MVSKVSQFINWAEKHYPECSPIDHIRLYIQHHPTRIPELILELMEALHHSHHQAEKLHELLDNMMKADKVEVHIVPGTEHKKEDERSCN